MIEKAHRREPCWPLQQAYLGECGWGQTEIYIFWRCPANLAPESIGMDPGWRSSGAGSLWDLPGSEFLLQGRISSIVGAPPFALGFEREAAAWTPQLRRHPRPELK